jgi:hypothetical protein
MLASAVMTAIDDLRHSIETRLGQIEQETAALHRALAALAGPAPRPTRPNRAAPAAAAPAAAAPAAAAPAVTAPAAVAVAQPRSSVVPAEKLATLLSSTREGATTGELAEQTGGERDQILTLLRELEQAGQVRRSGMRRGTRWHAVTDEDRIAQRAAELEARQAAARSRASADAPGAG